MPNGPSANVEHTISGPSAKRSGATASSMPRVTASFEFGLTTRMRGRAAIKVLHSHSGAERSEEPGIHNHHCCDDAETVQYGQFRGYGFRARAFRAPRNDGRRQCNPSIW